MAFTCLIIFLCLIIGNTPGKMSPFNTTIMPMVGL